ncbi:hypothetical protein OKA04_15860 [Luteolibacter flavescens]|uniref:Uncharacterized protein n=1 Tax=Luteolibacter flavescens TaxID=1859460 RepID=A0ABT3FRJ6_9BACT|nr:hypothetical protein [Luteolibacter flavescens]MCW1886213.1 hypothetical protein [Luteolibacter flavescens]
MPRIRQVRCTEQQGDDRESGRETTNGVHERDADLARIGRSAAGKAK